MLKEEYNQLTIEEKALLMEYISEDEDFKIISSIAFLKLFVGYQKKLKKGVNYGNCRTNY